MFISRLLLKDFRNFKALNMELGQGLHIFYGDNAQGKTNLLEAIYFCSTGRSQRTRSDRELISLGCNEAHIQAYICVSDTKSGFMPVAGVSTLSDAEKIDVHLKKDDKKGIAINGLSLKNLSDLYGLLLTVVFSPEDLQLVKEGPSERRKYMDVELCQLSKVYCYNLQQYHKVLKQRNNLLKLIVKKRSLKETLGVWDEQLVSYGSKIMRYRSDFMEKISVIAEKKHKQLTAGREVLVMQYKPNVTVGDFMERLAYFTDRDILLGSTSVGIHKDDIIFKINDLDVRTFGSQGQQRTACLSAKLSEIELIREQTGKSPVLLLDDVLSELDQSRQRHLMNSASSIQTIVTATGMADVLKSYGKDPKGRCYKIEKGTITSQTGV